MPVYIIRAGDTDKVKIGWADDPEKRRCDLQTAHYEDLRIIRTIDGPSKLERWLHKRFGARRLRREWFAFHSEMMTVTLEDVRPPPRPLRKSKTRYDDALRRALSAAGGVTKLAAHLHIVPSAIPQWRRVPAQHCQAVAAITKIPVTELRPDIFGVAA